MPVLHCTGCELVIAHKDELDAELAHALSRFAPPTVGKGYVVLGTLDRKVWQRGLRGEGRPLAETLEHVVEFEKVLQLEVDPGGWRPVGG